jgi:hypothetical protein
MTREHPVPEIVEGHHAVRPGRADRAERAGVVPVDEAILLTATRLVGMPMPRMARHLSLRVGTPRERRQRADAQRLGWSDGGRAAA